MVPTGADAAVESRLQSSTPTRRTVLASVATVGALGTAGCLGVLEDSSDSTGTADAEWPTYRGDRARTGRAPAAAGPGESLSIAWETGAEDVATAREDDIAIVEEPASAGPGEYAVVTAFCSPVTLTDSLVLGTAFYRLSGESGAPEWGGLVAMDAASGDVEWTVSGIPPGPQAPSIVDGKAYVPVLYPIGPGPEGSHLLVVEADTGSVVERIATDAIPRYPPTIDDTGAVVTARGTSDDDVLALDLDDGGRRWSRGGGRSTATYYPFSVSEGSVFYARRTSDERIELLALDAATGDRQWRRAVDVPTLPRSEVSEPLGTPCIDGDRGYVTGTWRDFERRQTTGSLLHAFDTTDGSERWQFRPDPVPAEDLPGDGTGFEPVFPDVESPSASETAGLNGTPLAVDGLVVAGGFGQPAPGRSANDAHHYVYAVDDEDGSLQWSVGGAIAGAVAAGDVIYARAVGDAIIAISTDGRRLDLVENDGELLSWGLSPTIGHGRLYSQWGRPSQDSSRLPARFVAFE